MEKFLSIEEAAAVLHVKPRTVRSYVAKGILKSYAPRGGKKHLLTVSEIMMFIGFEEAVKPQVSRSASRDVKEFRSVVKQILRRR